MKKHFYKKKYLLGSLLFFFVVLYLLKNNYLFFKFNPTITFISFFGFVLYLLAQFLKAFRLYTLYELYEYSFSEFCKKYLQYNSLLILLPFRLGDIYRIAYFKSYSSNYVKSFNILLIERMIDLFLLILVMIIIMFYGALINKELFIKLLIILILIFSLYFVLEYCLKLLQSFALRRSKSKFFPIFYKSIGLYGATLIELKKIINKKLMLFTSTTISIWMVEILAFIMMFEYTNPFEIQIVLLILFIILSFGLPLGPVGFGGIQLAAFWYFQLTNRAINSDFILSQTYLIYIFCLLIGLIVFAYEKIAKKK